MNNIEAYIICRDNMETGRPYPWDEWSALVGVEVANRNGNSDPFWTQYVDERQGKKTGINKLAQTRKQNWRIKIFQNGVSVIKYSDGSLAKADVPSRCKRIAQHFDCARKEWEALSDLKTMPREQKLLLKNSSDMFRGAAMSMRGAIQGMKLIPAPEKEQLINFFDIE